MVRIVLLLFAGSIVSAVAADAPALPPTQRFKLFLLVGQSNMAGRGKVEEQDKRPHSRVLALSKTDAWVPAVDPIHFDKSIAGVGLGTTFGKLAAEANPGDTIGLIPCAVGGTSIDQWKKGGKLYTEAVRRARLAMEKGTLAGILWHQGESDAANPADYAAKAQKFFADLRAELNAEKVPLVIGTLGDFQGKYGVINPIIQKLPESVPMCACVSADGLNHGGDKLHFDSASLRELGTRYFAKWQSLSRGK
ncbi:MAG TPA: sialate O-acetylesterase [Planctomycetota bacterium]|nr:sialate O-acetylesterase [Planctomycetota bacterium]